MKKYIVLIVWMASLALGANLSDFRLGCELLSEQNYELAAIEFRRFALESNQPEEQAMAYLHAAYAYIQSNELDEAKKMLKQAESRSGNSPESVLLNAEVASRQGDTPSTLYFLDLVPASDVNDPIQIFKTRRSAEMLLRSGDVDAAREQLLVGSTNEVGALTAVDQYKATARKNPKIGGLLGLFPGAGYWYSGETANGFRSLILNSLFMYGMYGTAEENLWGAFGVITFFEITWYSGSIYGGVDAAHRYNKQQLENCIDRLDVPDIKPNHEVTIPLFQLKVEF